MMTRDKLEEVAAATAPYAIPTECHRYEGRVAMIVGGGQGLGRAVAKRLAEEGAKIVIADMNVDKAERTASELTETTGQPVVTAGGDLAQPGTADAAVEQAMARFGRIDTLVEIAAYQARLPLLDFTEELMQKSINTNVWALVRVLRAVLPVMMEQRYGRIVTTGGPTAPFHTLLAGVGKGSQLGLACAVATEFGAFGITANCIAPGGIETRNDGTADSTAGTRDAHLNPTAEMMERYGIRAGAGGGTVRRPDAGGTPAHMSEVAAAYAFLGSYEAGWITGQYLKVSGGGQFI
jgi:2-hydroxycyclohexanecarboxyl-CoA dehydrogenase